MKKCKDCQKVKEYTEFHKHPSMKDGYRGNCKECRNKGANAYYANNKERAKLYSVTNSDKLRNTTLKRMFNITLEQFNQMLAAQGGVCLGCSRTEEEFGKRFSVDHDHTCCPEAGRSCGKCVRAILCNDCNMVLGYARDKAATLEKLAKLVA